MADKRFRSRLQKLFATGTIVRAVGKGKLKVVDTDELQMYPNMRKKQRYTPLHRSKWGGNYKEANAAFAAKRRELFRDYESMDNDPIIASALDIYADESTVKNEFGDILGIQSSDDNIQKILHNLFYDILNIEFNLWPWIRGMCKYGDFFLKLDVEQEVGVVNVKPLSVYEIEREEGIDPQKPNDVRFIWDGDQLQTQIIKQEVLKNFEVAHFRMLSDSNFIPYGKAIIENARRLWKQLSLMEDAMLIHRIMRDPEKRVYRIDIGNIPPGEVDAYLERISSQMKKIPVIDPRTGEYNLKFNIQNLIEDFFIPVRGSDSGTQIENLPGLEYQTIEDIDYLKGKMFAALKIPRSFLGYEEDTSGKATLASEDLRFARTIERVQRIVISELTKIAIIHLYSQGYEDSDLVNFSISLTPSSTVLEQEKIRIWQEKVRLAEDMKGNLMLPMDWIYKHVYELAEEEIEELREKVVEDAKFKFRLAQIEMEGNDPAKSGQTVMGGMATDPFGEAQPGMEQPGMGPPEPPAFTGEQSVNYDDPKFKQGGRPRENQTKYRTDKHQMGRDPIGDKAAFSFNEMKGLIRSMKDSSTNGTTGVMLLDESNIIGD